MATQTLPPVTFSVLNQTKTLSTAWCCFLLLGKPQSQIQVVALILLVGAALIIQKVVPLPECRASHGASKKDVQSVPDNEVHPAEEEMIPLDGERDKKNEIANDVEASKEQEKSGQPAEQTNREQQKSKYEETQLTKGVLPALLASLLSGLAGALIQKSLQRHQRSLHLLNIELSIISCIVIAASLLFGSPDYQKFKNGGMFQGWTWYTLIPVFNAASGGILVALVTKYQGAVVKGFTLIFGLLISGILQHLLLRREGGGVTLEQLVGGSLGAFSLWMHFSFPPKN